VKIEDLELFAGHAAVSERENGLERIRIISFDKNESHTITLPEPTYQLSVDENPEFDTSSLRFRYQSLVTPNSIFDYDMNSHQRVLVKQTEVPGFDATNYASERIFATASDGTNIPCSVVYRKGMRRNGRAR